MRHKRVVTPSSRSVRRTSRASRGAPEVGRGRCDSSAVRSALMATATEWVAASRPRPLSAAVAPVAVGVAVAHAARHVSIERALLSLVVSLAVQVGTNYANDYADGKRGT